MNIEESKLFADFIEISKIPRDSGSEKAVSEYIADRARGLGLEVASDELSNLIIRKPASPGRESRGAVMLQAHLDMVCEKSSESDHDFSKDPIEVIKDGDWLRANGTTLGADNGMGVAMALGILESPSLIHPPLEVVFTVREETDFAGAKEIDKSALKATRMINLDHACESEVIVGSCGGKGVSFNLPIKREPEIPAGFRPYRISINGLTGGHSGEDIHRGRANAIILALRLAEMSGLPFISIDGGSSRLAIPREASVILLSDDPSAIERLTSEAEALFRREYATDVNLAIAFDVTDCAYAPLDAESLMNIRACLRFYPNGIVRMSDAMPGIVESSDNVGIVQTGESCIRMVSEIRGAYISSISDILDSIGLLADMTGASVDTFAEYMPWSSRPDSALRDKAVTTYESMYARSMTPIAVHAGLECGFFATQNPDLDIISIGPDCMNFHSPEERVSISSAIRVYDFLAQLLSEL